MKTEFLEMVEGKYGERVREECSRLALLPEFKDATDIFVLDRALYEIHRIELEAADAEASLPFQSE